MNVLQHLPESKHGLVLVTLNPPFPIDPAKIVGQWTYHHPMMTQKSVAAQALLPRIQNTRGISYAGAWTKYGFHEDGFASAMRLVTSQPFNVKPPFPLKPANRSLPSPSSTETLARLVVSSLEQLRRAGEPVWRIISWIAILALVWLEQVLSIVGAEEGKLEVSRLKRAWVGKKAPVYNSKKRS